MKRKLEEKAKELYELIKREYPYTDVRIWETKFLNNYMEHQPLTDNIVIEVEEEVLEIVFHILYDRNEKVTIATNSKKTMNYLSKRWDSIMLFPLKEKRKKELIDDVVSISEEEVLKMIEEYPLMFESYRGKEFENIKKSIKERDEISGRNN